MRKDKEKALKLRKEGKSYREIKNALSVPVSTLSDWLSPFDWSKNIVRALSDESAKNGGIHLKKLNAIRGGHLENAYKQAEIEAKGEFERLKYHPLFIAGMMLYWGEGDKVSKNFVRITNTDPAIIKIFANFLFDICQIDKKRVACSLLLYPDLVDDVCKKYWIENSGLYGLHFHKSQVIEGKHKTNRLRYGVCTLTISSTYFKKKITTWTRLFSEELLSSEYYKPKL